MEGKQKGIIYHKSPDPFNVLRTAQNIHNITGHKQKVLQIQASNQDFSAKNHRLGLKGSLEVTLSRTLLKAEQLQS